MYFIAKIRVFLFSEFDSYLSHFDMTDDQGKAEFFLPVNTYKFRVDHNGKQYWSDPVSLVAFQENDINLNLDLLALNLTSNPYYGRYDGMAPEKEKILLASTESDILPENNLKGDHTVYYFINDHLGTPISIMDNQGLIVWSADHTPFGYAHLRDNAIGNEFRFPGQYFDEETGLHYNHNRYYDPDTGRYLTPDPIGLAGGINSFVYSHNNPISFMDPSGLKTTFIMNTLGGGGFFVSGSLGTATATSETVNGKYYEAKYKVVSIGFTAGAKVFGPAQPVFDIVSPVLKNASSGITGNQFTIDVNYPPIYTSYLDIEGHSVAFFGEAKLADIKVGIYEGGRADVKPFSFGPTGAFGLQLFKFEGVNFIRIGKPKEISVCDE